MEDYNKQISYGAPRSYSVSYAQTQIGPKDLKFKKGKSDSSRSSISKSWSFGDDPEFQKKKRVASYKMYTVEGKVKGSFRKSFKWLKNRYWHVVYNLW
ncbi:hypothetical protein RYX36_022532 [Vicia faba]